MRTVSFLLCLTALACRAETTVLGGSDTGATDTATDTAADTATDTGADTAADTGDTQTGLPDCVGDFSGTVTFSAEDPRSGELMELCAGDATLSIADDLGLTGTATCAGGDPGGGESFDVALTGEATARCALTADVTVTYGREGDLTATATASGSASTDAADLAWEGELQVGRGGGDTMPYSATIAYTR